MKKSRSSCPEVFCKNVILRNFAKFSRKHLHCSLFLLELRSHMLSCEFCKIFESTYFVKHWWTTAFENHVYFKSIEQPKFQSDDVNQIFRTSFQKLLKNLAHRIGKDLCCENTKFHVNQFFLFSSWRLFSFLNFMNTWSHLTEAILIETWPWHSRSRSHKITGKSGLKLWKLVLWVVK